MLYAIAFLGAMALAWAATIAAKRYALRHGILDRPGAERKIHKQPIPLLGGTAIFVSFWLLILILVFATDILPAKNIEPHFLWGVFAGGLILMIGGFLDDKYSLKPHQQIIFPLLAVAAVIGSGIGIEFVSNPLGGGLWFLDRWQWQWGLAGGRALSFVLIADLFTLVWLLGMMYTTKLLDGLDGLVSGIAAIGALVIFILSLTDKTFQPDVALLAVILGGAALGFLFWNAHPARIFLGEGGSVWLGFMLGVLAIISGGKIATALLIMGIAILDTAWVIGRRIFFEKRSPAQGDAKHLHFRLIAAGLSHRRAVFLLWGLSALFGAASLLAQTRGKIYLLVVLVLVMVLLGLWATKRSTKRRLS